jgi:mono/diheme cytochrome c family protein
MRISPKLLVVCLGFVLAGSVAAIGQTSPRWTIPAGAAEEKSPIPVNAATLAGGKKLFEAKCANCHGPKGLGDGPDADPKYIDTMNLTSAARAARNADGQVFYKIWNGRLNPKMPAFSEELTKEQAWAIVAYAQSLRGQ